MMSILHVALSSLIHHWRANLILALGMAAATAVLTGALIVGDSMRASLRNLALDRLGRIDEMVVSDGFFRVALADEIGELEAFQKSYRDAEAAIVFPNGSVENRDDTVGDNRLIRRASNVNVLGVTPSFWSLGDRILSETKPMSGRQAIINQTLATRLELRSEDAIGTRLTLRIPKPTQLPSDSALGKKRDLVESLVDLEAVQVLPDRSLARFGLRPSQLEQANIFVPRQLLAEVLSREALQHKSGAQANVIFLAGQDPDRPPTSQQSDRLFAALQPSLTDLGLRLKHVVLQRTGEEESVAEYYNLSSDRLVLTDEIVASVQAAFPDAVPVSTYLANDIRKQGTESGIPFSMISAIDIGPGFPLTDVNDQPIGALASNEIVLNKWAAENLDAEPGDGIQVRFFEPESVHGKSVERQADFKLKAVAKLAQPSLPFQVRRRQVIPAQFEDQTPTLANDPDFTPEVPGLTDAESIEKWDLPFETAGKIRAADDVYWNEYRTTPKAYISLGSGQQLWQSRFGKTTSFRIPVAVGSLADVEQALLKQFRIDQTPLGFRIVSLKRNAIDASSGSTPFDILFLALSMFVIASALILVSLLFRLTLNRRSAEIGSLLATGFPRRTVSRLLLLEMSAVALGGALIGIGLGIAYAALMIHGLRTWWLGAISKPVLDLKISPQILAIGAVSGLVICFLTIVLTVRGSRKYSILQMLSGELDRAGAVTAGQSRWGDRFMMLALLGAVALSIVAAFLGGEPQAGAFMGAGFLVLTAALLAVYRYLTQSVDRRRDVFTLSSLASMSGRRNPMRSTLTIGLVGVASFLIVAVSSFRLAPSEAGTAGFDLIAHSDQPIFEDLSDVSDQQLEAFSIRVQAGEDASCTNLYQSSQPRVLGVPQSFIADFDADRPAFRWSATTAETAQERANPWQLLNRELQGGRIPVVIDKNTANYSLKLFATGVDYPVEFDTGEKVVFHVVGFLENSILQGSLIVSEQHFTRAFPDVSGYRMFLIRARQQKNAAADMTTMASSLEDRYGDQGFDAESAAIKLAEYQQVQNTYISTFQTLGALGLLLGTFGLAAVQIRNVLERQKELGLMRSAGFSLRRLSWLVLLENIWLLLVGLAVGLGSALVTTLPHYFAGGASIPWMELAMLFVLILLFGLLSAAMASRITGRLPLIQSLRV